MPLVVGNTVKGVFVAIFEIVLLNTEIVNEASYCHFEGVITDKYVSRFSTGV